MELSGNPVGLLSSGCSEVLLHSSLTLFSSSGQEESSFASVLKGIQKYSETSGGCIGGSGVPDLTTTFSDIFAPEACHTPGGNCQEKDLIFLFLLVFVLLPLTKDPRSASGWPEPETVVIKQQRPHVSLLVTLDHKKNLKRSLYYTSVRHRPLETELLFCWNVSKNENNHGNWIKLCKLISE